MIKFRIQPKIWEGKRCKFGKEFKNVKIIDFFDIFLAISHKMKENLSQEHVKGASILPGKNWKIAPDFPREMTVFFQFWPYFSTCLSLKSGFLTHTKIIFLKWAIIGLFATEVS